MSRRCSRPGCRQIAVYTLTYVYRDSTAVLGPLAESAQHDELRTLEELWDSITRERDRSSWLATATSHRSKKMPKYSGICRVGN